jgi:hypothetical protein
MSKTVEYRVIPVNRWVITRFESGSDGQAGYVGSTQRGEFQNEEEANEVATLLAKAEDCAKFISRASMNRPVSGPIAGGGLSAS